MKSSTINSEPFLKLVKESIRKHEGFKPKGYIDTLGVLTIGYGFSYLERDEAECVLNLRIKKIDKRLRERYDFYQSLPQTIKGVLIEMAYQLGLRGLSRFKRFLYALAEKDYDFAAVEILASKLGKQSPSRAEFYARQICESGNLESCVHTLLHRQGQ